MGNAGNRLPLLGRCWTHQCAGRNEQHSANLTGNQFRIKIRTERYGRTGTAAAAGMGILLLRIKNLNAALAVLDELENYRNMADKIINAYPDSLAAEALRSMKTLSEPEMNDGAEILAEKIRETIKKLLEADNK